LGDILPVGDKSSQNEDITKAKKLAKQVEV
jgi:putative component of toxin-antitoxin plasmid stabilization module